MNTSSLTMAVEAVTHATQWLASQREALVKHGIILTDSMNLLQKGGVWNGLPRLTHSHAPSSGAETSVDLLSWARRSQWQTDRQAQQISHLACSLAGQRCSEAWGTLWTWTGQSITALIVWRKEEWRKKAVDIPPSKVENDMCSTRQILALFQGQLWGDCWDSGRSSYGPFRALQCHLELKLNLKLELKLKFPKVNQ